MVKKNTKTTKSKEQSLNEISVYNTVGEVVEKVSLPKEFADVENKQLLLQSLRVFKVNQRAGRANTKVRGEVRGGGKKPWRQKGTGRARQGSTRAPHWKGGGVVFGPKPRIFELSFPTKMKKTALISALVVLSKNNRIEVLDDHGSKLKKTAEYASLFKKITGFEKNEKICVVTDTKNDIEKKVRNLNNVNVLKVSNLTTYHLVNCQKAIFTKEAWQKVVEKYK